ncbi:MAG: electron transport complex subunit RsxC [Clostridia bacterium]|nr:electron transport complex subunit RsxC [Clostridia bacterium]
MKATFRGGVHPAHGSKRPTQALAIRDFVSDTVQIMMNMHIGAPSKPCVKKGDHVLLGQVIGEPVGGLGLPVHASVSGEVVSVDAMPSLSGDPAQTVTIKNDFQDEWVELHPLGNVETVDPALIIPAVRDAGICGMGGASFPTHVKMTVPEGKKCEFVLANGAECETHITCDDRLMQENATRVVDGLRAVMRAMDVRQGIIGIEDNKPAAIAAMEKACQGRDGVRVQVIRTKYPQGGEKQLIQVLTGREVPSGGLPIDCGCVVVNVGTCAAIADAIIDGKPLIDRICTVTGAVRSPANLRVRIGTITADIVGECGGYSVDPGKIFFGGAMTGLALPNDGMPTAKATNGIVVFSREDAASPEEDPCIRCGKCVVACPIGLNPYDMKISADIEKWDDCKKKHVLDCMLCGACSFICPARRWLTPSFKIAKQKIAEQAKKEAAAK